MSLFSTKSVKVFPTRSTETLRLTILRKKPEGFVGLGWSFIVAIAMWTPGTSVWAQTAAPSSIAVDANQPLVKDLAAKGEIRGKLPGGLTVAKSSTSAESKVNPAGGETAAGKPAPGRVPNSCNQSNYQVVVSPDGEAISVFFSEFVFSPMENDPYLIYPNPRKKTLAQKTCKIDVGLRLPRDWTFAIHRLTVLGYQSIDSGSSGMFTMNYSYPRATVQMVSAGSKPPGTGGIKPDRNMMVSQAQFPIRGPVSGELMKTASFAIWNFAPCMGRERDITVISLASTITVQSQRMNDQYVAIDLIDSSISAPKANDRSLKYGLQWVPCRSLMPKKPDATIGLPK